MRPRTQVGVAVSADGANYLLVGASPDLRQQVLASPALRPRTDGRDSPIFGVALISGDVDGMAGLLTLRESQAFTVFAPAPLLQTLTDNPIFGVLDPALVRRRPVVPLEQVDCGHGIALTLLPMPGKVPLYLEDRSAPDAQAAPTYAARIDAAGRTLIVAPGCAEITEDVLAMLRTADTVLFDGTVFTDDEMIAEGVGAKTGQRMGHVAISGAGGSLARLRSLPGRRIYFHINNTNPILLDGSPEQAAVIEAGFEIAHDGMTLCP